MIERRWCYVCGWRWRWRWDRKGCTHPGRELQAAMQIALQNGGGGDEQPGRARAA